MKMTKKDMLKNIIAEVLKMGLNKETQIKVISGTIYSSGIYGK